MAQFGIISLTCSFGAVVLSVVNHFYLNPLSKTEAGDWLHQHPTAIGETVLYMGESYYYFAFTIVTWCRFSYGEVLCHKDWTIPFHSRPWAGVGR